jgi:hypothetical protein
MKFFLRTSLYIVLIIIVSCSQQKKILKGDTLFQITSDGFTPGIPSQDTFTLHRFTVTQSFNTAFLEKDTYIVLQSNPTSISEVSRVGGITSPTWRSEIINKYYYSDEENLIRQQTAPLWYFDTKPVLQALTVPLKIRPKLRDAAYKDSFPSTTETGINIALAGGVKFAWNQYKSTKNFLGLNTQKYSIALGAILGTGAADLQKTNTRNPVIEFGRKAPLVTTGMFFMLGVNNINIGYSFGADRAKGVGGHSWIYDGRIWHGVTVGLDIIK